MGLNDRVRNAAGTVASLGAAGAVVAGCLEFDPHTGQLMKFKLGPLAVWDRRRMEARRARRAARRARQKQGG